MAEDEVTEDFFALRFYAGHESPRFGHEFLEFEINNAGQLVYANNSNYRKSEMIRREVTLSKSALLELMRIIRESEILDLSDEKWPEPGSTKQELEIILDKKHLWFESPKLSSRRDCENTGDPDGMLTYFYLVEELKAVIMSYINVHFKIDPF